MLTMPKVFSITVPAPTVVLTTESTVLYERTFEKPAKPPAST